MNSRQKKGNGTVIDPDKLMEGLTEELGAALKAMRKAKDINEKETYSRIVKNLSKSLGVFFDLLSEMMVPEDDDLEDEGLPL